MAERLGSEVFLFPSAQVSAVIVSVIRLRQFHLNEPWDSAHNRTLVAQLPAVFVSPLAPGDLAVKGLTT